ncbi:MAG: hypothetical protein JWO15_3677 [Sphingomonadales bacterium]|nr:hypothetical protein [Sphingomonadales bacterium]
MAAKIVISQVGLAAGRENQSRSDGLRTGGQVSFKHIGTGVATFELLWVPDDDNTAVASFAQNENEATFTPDSSSIGGTYRIGVTLLQGRDVIHSIRLFSIRTENFNLRLLALGEGADESASFVNHGQDVVQASEFNEPSTTGPFSQGNYGGWYSSLVEVFKKVEELSGG